ncbi:MAG: response regulator [Chloroflexi bacterium]|nr:response regulator [Chloroflexota bacterium]
MTGSNQRILLVDDDLAMLKLLRYTLEKGGYHVVVASDSAAAPALAAKGKDLDLIVLEIDSLPEESTGICRRLRQSSDVPIIILTARYDEEAMKRGIEAGADDFIGKPFGIFEFMARVKAVLRRAGAVIEGAASQNATQTGMA